MAVYLRGTSTGSALSDLVCLRGLRKPRKKILFLFLDVGVLQRTVVSGLYEIDHMNVSSRMATLARIGHSHAEESAEVVESVQLSMVEHFRVLPEKSPDAMQSLVLLLGSPMNLRLVIQAGESQIRPHLDLLEVFCREKLRNVGPRNVGPRSIGNEERVDRIIRVLLDGAFETVQELELSPRRGERSVSFLSRASSRRKFVSFSRRGSLGTRTLGMFVVGDLEQGLTEENRRVGDDRVIDFSVVVWKRQF